MKKFLLILTACLLFFPMVAQNYTAIVVYTEDDARSVLAAAILKNKFSTTLINVGDKQAATYGAEFTALSDSSYHKVFVVCDTTNADTKGYLQGTYVDTLAFNLAVTTLNTLSPDASVTVIKETATTSFSDSVWNLSSVYSGVNPPLIVKYLSYDDFSELRATATGGTDSSLTVSGASYTDNAYQDDEVFVISGTAIGMNSTIDSNNDSVLIFNTTKFTTGVDSLDVFVVKKANQDREFWYDEYARCVVEADLKDPDANWSSWKRLIDDNNKLNDGVNRAYQDRTYLKTLLQTGESIFNYLKD